MKRLKFKAAKTTYETLLKVFIMKMVSKNSFGAIYLSRLDLPLHGRTTEHIEIPFLLMK